MTVAVLIILLLVDVILLGATMLQNRGYGWADQVCLRAHGLCDQRYWLVAATALLAGILYASKNN